MRYWINKLQFGPECERDFLVILSGGDTDLFRNNNDDDEFYLGHYCSSNPPHLGHPIKSNSNVANVVMVTKFGGCHRCKGFSLKFLAGKHKCRYSSVSI